MIASSSVGYHVAVRVRKVAARAGFHLQQPQRLLRSAFAVRPVRPAPTLHGSGRRPGRPRPRNRPIGRRICRRAEYTKPLRQTPFREAGGRGRPTRTSRPGTGCPNGPGRASVVLMSATEEAIHVVADHRQRRRFRGPGRSGHGDRAALAERARGRDPRVSAPVPDRPRRTSLPGLPPAWMFAAAAAAGAEDGALVVSAHAAVRRVFELSGLPRCPRSRSRATRGGAVERASASRFSRSSGASTDGRGRVAVGRPLVEGAIPAQLQVVAVGILM